MTRPPPIAVWRLSAERTMTLHRARLFAIVNITPDSFSDGGLLKTPDDAARAAQTAVRHGADGLDVGGESTRPGSQPVPDDEQIRRVVPAIRAIRAAGIDAPITIDTRSSVVAAAALDAGADGVNDVSGGLDDRAMLPLAAARGCGVVLMHRLVRPEADRYSDQHPAPPNYGPEPADGADLRDARTGVFSAVRDALRERAEAALSAGVRRDAIVLDPGLGFGKSVEQNLRLVRASRALVDAMGYPMLGGASRKSFIGKLTGVQTPAERVHGSIAASVAQRLGGFTLFRVHDVAAQAAALRVTDALTAASKG